MPGANYERRFTQGATRASSSADSSSISGYGAIFNSLSEDLGGFREKINPGAFKRTLAAGRDVYCTFNHDPNRILGRRSNGSLDVSTDSKGLRYTCKLNVETSIGKDVLEFIRRSDVKSCSFAFRCIDDEGQSGRDPDSGKTMQIRTLLDVELIELGPVLTPAYAATSVQVDAAARSARSQVLFPQGMPAEVRSRINSPRLTPDAARPTASASTLIDSDERAERAAWLEWAELYL
jgi:uncharacterized protein